MTNPMVISILAFAVVAVLVAAVFFLFTDRGTGRAAERLDTLVGKRRKESAADMLLKQSAQEADKRNLMDALMPNVLSLEKLFEQADCNIKPSSLFGVALVLAVVTGSFSFLLIKNIFIAPIVVLVGFSLPFGWLLNKRR